MKGHFADKTDEAESIVTPMMTDRIWHIMEPMLDVYLLLCHRIEGWSLSLDAFWEMDTWTVSKFYCIELALIDKEEKGSGNKSKGGTDPEGKNDPEVEELYMEMFGNDED